MRLLFAANAPWCSSGYGVQSKSLLPRLAALPEVGGRENVGIFAWWGLKGGIMGWEGFKVYPLGDDGYGNDRYETYVKDFQADALITLIDVWVVPRLGERIAPVPWLPWMPVDADPVSFGQYQGVQTAAAPMVFSKWGSGLLDKAGVKNLYVPCGIEPDVFKVLPDEERTRFRQESFGGDYFMVTMVAANKGQDDRKGFAASLRAFAQFAKDKEDVRLYLHTEPSRKHDGVDLGMMAALLGIQTKTLTPEQWRYDIGYPDTYMAQVYNASDVLLLNSKREGFGIPLIEAQACGCPVITSAWASQPELARWGHVIEPLDLEWCGLGSWQAIPDSHKTYLALEEMYEEWRATRGWDRELRLDAEQQIHREYSWDVLVHDYWHPLLTRLADGHDLLSTQPAPDFERRNGASAQHGNTAALDDNGGVPSPEPSIAELVG